jgi:hypothetical protein
LRKATGKERLISTQLGHSGFALGTALPATEEPFTARLRISFLFLEFSVDVCNATFTFALKAVQGGTEAK